VSDPPTPSARPRRLGWTRDRALFLGVSGALFVALVWWAAEVMLPFILAVILAYVLTPAVARCERLKIPRALSILLVYVVTLGGLYVTVALITPRLYEESMTLARDTPDLSERLTTTWAPRVERFAQGIIDRVSKPKPAEEPAPAFEVQKRPDGTLAVELRSGVQIVQEDAKHWRVLPINPDGPAKFSASEMARAAAGQVVDYIKRNALDLLKVGQAIFGKVARSIFLFFMTLMVAAYLMLTRENVLGFLRSLPPPSARVSFDRLMKRIDRGLAGVVRGQLLICLVNGVLSAIGFWMFGLKYWPIMAVMAAVMSLIPIFGSIMSTVPVVLIGLTQDFFTALWVLLWVIGIHQVEANLLNPKIIGAAAKIHPVLVVFSLIVGEHFFGLWGALLAVPALSLAQSVFLHFRYELLPDAGPDSLLPSAETPTPSGR
jgi:predicted PurR-regulated permease PerM